MPVELPTETPFLVTTKFEKYGTYTILARSKEHAIKKFEDGEWDFDDYEEEWGEYNEVIYEVEDENVFDQKQLVLEGVLWTNILLLLQKQVI